MFQTPPSRDRQAIRLICIPHAGGGPSAFRGWKELLSPEIEATIVQLPGREGRFRDEPYQRLEVLVSDLTDALLPFLTGGQKFAFFGNSLGGLIAFEALHAIRRRTGLEAAHFFVSACGAPHLPPRLPPMGHLSDRELVRELADRYGGFPAEILDDEGFLAAMMPTMRADINVLEAYQRCAPQPLSCPITAFAGRRDKTVPADNIEGWSAQTTASFTSVFLDEEHLYLQSSRETLIAGIREALLASVRA
jgi:surfactin synthase thioesterase subunit